MSTAIPPGTGISHFRVIKKLGAGGMGEVYLAEDARLGRPVTLKFLHAEVAADERRMRRFIQEARAASALNHPNILTVYEFDQWDSVRFIAAEHIEGETLRQHLYKSPPGLAEALDIAAQVASALAAAHANKRKKIVHRDVKPENIMIRRDGLVKVLDFGLAKPEEQARLSGGLDTEAPTKALVSTEPGVVMGTAAYMSPEQARGKAVDKRTDVWAFGCVLFEMLTGTKPFESDTLTDTVAAIVKTEPDWRRYRQGRRRPSGR
jgi:eukaryotic-like serine/threonine-protein kinase